MNFVTKFKNLITKGLSVFGSANITGNLVVDTNTLFVDSVNDRVGIGTASPSQLLHISSATSNSQLLLENTTESTGVGQTSPQLRLTSSMWNTASGPSKVSAYLQLSPTLNANPASGKLSFFVGEDVSGISEKMSISSDGVFSIAGGADFAGPSLSDTYSVKIRNLTEADGSSGQSSNKLQFQGSSRNIAAGVRPSIGYLQINNTVNNTTSPIDRLSFFVGNDGVTPTEKMSITSTGNVGIGATTPDYDLTIGGPSIAERSIGLFRYNNGNLSRFGLSIKSKEHGVIASTDRVEFGVAHAGNPESNPVMSLISNGSVGIGTVTPSTKLDVNGTANFAGNVTMLGTADVTGTTLMRGVTEVNNGGSIYLDSTVSFTVNDVSRPYLFNMYDNGAHRMSLTRTGGYFAIGPIIASTIGGAMATIRSNFATDKCVDIKGVVGQSGNYLNISTVSDTGDILTVLANGKVGIGNSTPTAKLEVDTLSATIGQIIKAAPSQTANLQQWQDSSGNVLAAIDGTDGSMSIGGPALSKTGGGGTLQINSTNAYATLKLVSTTADWGFFTTSGGDFIFRNNGSTDPFIIYNYAPTHSLGILANGNVGVGVTADNQANKLTVSGNTSIGSGYTTTAAPTNGLIVEGNVGIGTATPTAKLTIVGSSLITTNDLLFTYDGAGNYKNGISNTFSNAFDYDNKMSFLVCNKTVSGQVTAMTLRGDGNVGIGTASPSYKLEVNGTANFAGNVTMLGTTTVSNGLTVGSSTTFKIYTTQRTPSNTVGDTVEIGNLGLTIGTGYVEMVASGVVGGNSFSYEYELVFTQLNAYQ